ncbi:hypothetical protein [Pelotomaculum propionicicum]|nr:hypothetical protein [Pelotomaculum propionicicum]NLI13627.1 hypothetical protein [Peptococcaceae bacterium]
MYNNLGFIIAVAFLVLAVAVMLFWYYFSGYRVFGGRIKTGNDYKKPGDE